MSSLENLERDVNNFTLKFDEIKEFIFMLLDKISLLYEKNSTNDKLFQSLKENIDKSFIAVNNELQSIKNLSTESKDFIVNNAALITDLKEVSDKFLKLINSNLLSLEKKLIDVNAPNHLEQRVYDKLDVMLHDLNLKLTNGLYKIVSNNISNSDLGTMEDRILHKINLVLNYCVEIDKIFTNMDTLSINVNDVKTMVGDVSNKLETFKIELDKALEYIQSNGSITEPTPPFNPKPDKIYTTNAQRFLIRTYKNDTIELKTYKEYFVINNNAPAMCKIQYDLEVGEINEPLYIEVIVNDNIVFTQLLNLVVGKNHFEHTCLFQLQRTNGSIYLRFYSVKPKYKKITNIKFEMVGDNVVFLRDAPSKQYYLYSCNKDYFLYKKENKTLYYKSLPYADNDFGKNFEVMAPYSEDYEYWPLFSATKDDQNKYSIFNKASYGRRSAETDKFEIMDNIKNEILLSLPNNIEGNKIEYADSGAFMMNGYGTVALYGICPEYSKGVSFNLNRTLVSSIHNYYNRFKFKVVNISLVYNTRTAIGYTDYYGTMVFQNEFGEWFLNSKSKINNKDGVNIGFGTRVNLSLVSPFKVRPDKEFCYRIFMYVYNHWVAKYVVMISSEKYEIIKSKDIPGDYDQIISGTSNEYFTIKDGRFEKHIDSEIPPIEDYFK